MTESGEVTAFALCQESINRMLMRSQTKVIFPIITMGLLQEYVGTGQTIFTDAEVRRLYEGTIRRLMQYLDHDLHIGGKYYDAYPLRNLPKYGVLRVLEDRRYELQAPFTQSAGELVGWIPERLKLHISDRLGIVPLLSRREFRAEIADEPGLFVETLAKHFDLNPTNFEIISFAVIKVHLERFACKIYRDTRTSAHDSGVDLSTNFGVVYQIKKLKVYSRETADSIYTELKANFDRERLVDGSVILVIDDISADIKKYLIDMKIQSISKSDVLKLASQFDDVEDREKVLRIVYEEFRREYSSVIN